MNDQELHALCEAWRRWALSRKFYLEPGAQNALARMQPAKSGEPPNARLSAELNYFNMALHAVAEMDPANAEVFNIYYCRRVRNIRAVAREMGISRDTFYERKKKFVRRAYSLSLAFRDIYRERGDLAGQNAQGID